MLPRKMVHVFMTFFPPLHEETIPYRYNAVHRSACFPCLR